MTGTLELKATEAQMDKAEKALDKYLSLNPQVQVDKHHPEVAHIEIENDHDYIRESFGGFLENNVEEIFEPESNVNKVPETERDDFSVIKTIYQSFFNAMPEVCVNGIIFEDLIKSKV